ncbi:DinB family protein [Georgenia sp. H159]|uniref:DinB family protein n=1 Tax=Georgenia sp. H159 TaxID=3076115 RepID=UPI002D79DB23|nr:DinB family protein [Georgenia sp. H159]
MDSATSNLDGPVDRAGIAAELERARADLHALLATASPAQLRAGSEGTRWTNEQLLFHMVFGFLVVRRLVPLVRFVSLLPEPVGRRFAHLLNAGQRPFHLINYLGSCGATLVFNHRRMGSLCDRTIAALTLRLHTEHERTLARGMPFPTSWDPYFSDVMTLAEVYAYPVQHYDHHRGQLTLPIQGVHWTPGRVRRAPGHP